MSLTRKASRLLTCGRVRVRQLDDQTLEATVIGDTDNHHVHWTERDGWTCSCVAYSFSAQCSHQLAVELVTTQRTTQEESDE
jgi:uncharacterized Zn finger protein